MLLTQVNMKKTILLFLRIFLCKYSFTQPLQYCALTALAIVNPTNCACCGTISAMAQTSCPSHLLNT